MERRPRTSIHLNSSSTPSLWPLRDFHMALSETSELHNPRSPWRETATPPTRNRIVRFFQLTYIPPKVSSHCIPRITSALPNSKGRKSSTTSMFCSDKTTPLHTPSPQTVSLVPMSSDFETLLSSGKHHQHIKRKGGKNNKINQQKLR